MSNFLLRLFKVIAVSIVVMITALPCGLCILSAAVLSGGAYLITGHGWAPAWLIENNHLINWTVETLDDIIAMGNN
jgi:hypothetical protein